MPTRRPLCDECAEREMRTVREGGCLLTILADARGTPRDVLLAQYVRIQ